MGQSSDRGSEELELSEGGGGTLMRQRDIRREGEREALFYLITSCQSFLIVKNMIRDFLIFSKSPQGNRLVKSIPIESKLLLLACTQ